MFFFCVRLWECVYKQINSVIYFGQKKGEGDGMEWNGIGIGKGEAFFQ